MKKLLFVTFAAAAILLASHTASLACSCAGTAPNETVEKWVNDARNFSKAVFVGTVVEIVDPNRSDLTVRFRVERTWKDSMSEVVNIVTARNSAACGYPFKIGSKYLVYAYGDSLANLFTGICARTAPLADAAEDLKILGEGKAVGSASAAYGQKEVLSSFCKFPLTETQMQANFTFTQGYRIKIDKEGRVSKVDRILGKEEWVSIDKPTACFTNWRFTGFDDGRAFVVVFRWKHGIGWTDLTISGGGFSQRVLSGDSEPCPTSK